MLLMLDDCRLPRSKEAHRRQTQPQVGARRMSCLLQFFGFLPKKKVLLAIGSLVVLPTAQSQEFSQLLEMHRKAVAITGEVVDQRGDPVKGATITLLQAAVEVPGTETVNEDGSFFIHAEVAALDLQVRAPGFVTKPIHEEINGQERVDLGKITLTIEPNATEVTVTVTRQQLAEEQVRVEAGQRILGIIPNFLVTYDRYALPLNAKQKYELALRTLVDPETIGVDFASAELQQRTGGSKGYGAGPGGFAKRFVASYGTDSIDTLLGSAVFPSIFKQDPRYFYKGTGSLQRRALYAMSMSVVCKGDSGHWQYNYSGLLAGLAAGGIANLYQPGADRRGFNVTLGNAAIGIGSSAISNLFQEFLIRRFVRNSK